MTDQKDLPSDRADESLPSRIRLALSGHTIEVCPDGRLIVEWYDFGDDAPYESANQLIFEPAALVLLVKALNCPKGSDASSVATALAANFSSYFEIREFVSTHSIPFEHLVDFEP